MTKEFLEKNYCFKNCDELAQKECHEGIRTRCLAFEEREELLKDFADPELVQKNIELEEKIKGLENILRKQLHCSGCVHSDSPCMPSDYKKDENDLCSNYESVFDKLQELEKELAAYKKKDKSLKCKQKHFVTSQTVNNGLVYRSVVCNTIYDCELCDKYRE